ncbi:MAG: YkgJ family cysteine cluster protein [Phycisphaerae bacterium]|nr:YkgJ family cysteine cluster protein [Phycisphaerae bacterium]
MNDIENLKDAPWYIAGLAFECTECGHCCAGPEEGFVWATNEELSAIAKFMKMSDKAFHEKYVRAYYRRTSLIEKTDSKDCIFLENGKCRIYSVRPTQCRTWPFWTSNISDPEDWSEAAMRCPGINRGKLHPHAEIVEKAVKTKE